MMKAKPPSIILGLDKVHDSVFTGRFLDKVGQDLAMHTGLEDDAAPLQIICYLPGVDDITVRGNGEVSSPVVEEQRLHTLQAALGIVGILDAADTHLAGKVVEFTVGEDFAQKPEPTVAVILAGLVEGGYSAALLSAML